MLKRLRELIFGTYAPDRVPDAPPSPGCPDCKAPNGLHVADCKHVVVIEAPEPDPKRKPRKPARKLSTTSARKRTPAKPKGTAKRKTAAKAAPRRKR